MYFSICSRPLHHTININTLPMFTASNAASPIGSTSDGVGVDVAEIDIAIARVTASRPLRTPIVTWPRGPGVAGTMCLDVTSLLGD